MGNSDFSARFFRGCVHMRWKTSRMLFHDRQLAGRAPSLPTLERRLPEKSTATATCSSAKILHMSRGALVVLGTASMDRILCENTTQMNGAKKKDVVALPKSPNTRKKPVACVPKHPPVTRNLPTPRRLLGREGLAAVTRGRRRTTNLHPLLEEERERNKHLSIAGKGSTPLSV